MNFFNLWALRDGLPKAPFSGPRPFCRPRIGCSEGCRKPQNFKTRKRHPNLNFWAGYFRVGWGLLREGVGAEKFDMSLETKEIQLFGWNIPGFCRDIPEVPEKFEKKKCVFDFCSLNLAENRSFSLKTETTDWRPSP